MEWSQGLRRNRRQWPSRRGRLITNGLQLLLDREASWRWSRGRPVLLRSLVTAPAGKRRGCRWTRSPRGLGPRDVSKSCGRGRVDQRPRQFVLVGLTGVGKSWLASAWPQSLSATIGRSSISGLRLFSDLALARGDGRIPGILRQPPAEPIFFDRTTRPSRPTPSRGMDLLEILEERYERRSPR